ncbi:class I SAM-dependent methyltransferase [Cognatishimia sp. MH4019]|uniref:class I SAM-dependent methyltransferase n=1 Tax=Cognatishimia sp. MH4019 TaxID=2854030 RepID=UPI001CD4C861|nr:methyltransferase [Cognatishimia sp. MH4019]
MRPTRLSLAQDGGTFALPDEGTIAVFRPRWGDDLAALPKERVQIVQGFKPDHDAFAQAGYDAQIAPQGRFAFSIVCIPRAKAEARVLIAQACALTDGVVVVDGQKTDGIDSLYKACRKEADVTAAFSKAHGKTFAFPATDAFADWAASASPQKAEDGFYRRPGVFSADGIDAGSEALANALPKLKGTGVDLGAGWGYLSAQALAQETIKTLHLVEAEAAALDCARLNVTNPRAQFHWADATRFTLPDPVDFVLTNPPFHTERAADPAIGQAFLQAAAHLLTPRGEVWAVANRHLPYEAHLATLFQQVEEVGGTRGFKLLRAVRPMRSRSSR